MIRIGHNPNTNMLPMFYFLSREQPLLEWVTAEPTGHNRMLAEGRIDTAPISAFSYGEHWSNYALFPDLSVSTRGRVGSILLFSKVPMAKLNRKLVALTSNSATSVNLLKILLHRYYNVFPDYITMSGGLEEMFGHADAALLIADVAIQAAAGSPSCYIYDLGEEWFNHTSYPMTYAIWAFPKQIIQSNPSELRQVHNLLIKAKNQALENMDKITRHCVSMLGMSQSFWVDYFARFSYGLDLDFTQGMIRYYELCYEEGLLPNKPELNFWP